MKTLGLILLVMMTSVFAHAGVSEVVSDNFTTIILALLAISELLALIPAVKANSIYQLVVEVLRKLAGKSSAE